MKYLIRKAEAEDAALVLAFVRKLAVFEDLEHRLVTTTDQIREALSGSPPRLEAFIAAASGMAIGLATFYPLYSTFAGKSKLYLEDLYVEPEYRGRGVARKLMQHLAAEASARGAVGLEWKVLDWNEEAISFYRGVGATPVQIWLSYGMGEKAMASLAQDLQAE